MINNNEKKAKQIAEYLNKPNGSNCLVPCHQAAMAMANWKDEQFQRVLDHCETCFGVFCFNEREKFINKIKELYYSNEKKEE